MRNLKRVLSLALAMVMVLGVMIISSSAASKDFVDADKIDYVEAVDVLTGLGVLEGYSGSFNPDEILTREQAAKVLCYIMLGEENANKLGANSQIFKDVAPTRWSAGYIAYCSNLGLIAGYNGNFDPEGQLTGVAFAKLLLVAAGYDAEAEGYVNTADWAMNVASAAIDAKIDVKGAVLANPLTREQMAQMVLQALEMDTVRYEKGTVIGLVGPYTVRSDNTVDYNGAKDKVQQFCEKYYPTLKKVSGGEDVWGRPYEYQWKYTVSNKTSILYTEKMTPVYENIVKVDECDIADAIGLKKATAIEKAYIDGDSYITTSAAVTTNQYGTINPLATTSYVGAQGRILEVYDMGTDGLRIVEINTYLAWVDKVTPAYTDKNGHVVDATIDLIIYNGTNNNDANTWNIDGVKATGYSYGDYVLVTVSNVDGYSATPSQNKAVVESVKTAPTAAGGALTGWTNGYATVPGTHTLGVSNTYKDADKFALNYHDSGVWVVLTDNYGNAIGLADVATNYLVIEKIEWKHNQSGFGGYALADVVLADGSKVSGVTVATVDNKTISNTGDAAGNKGTPSVSDSYVNNGTAGTGYYNHIWSYSVNADGSYNLAAVTHYTASSTTANVMDLVSNALYNQGTATISGQTNTVVATDNTVFLYKNQTPTDGYTYTVYVGKTNAPSITGATMCVKYDTYGYAELVVVSSYALATNSFLAYVTDNGIDAANTSLGNGYNVYKLGETTPTMVYDATNLSVAVTGAAAWSYDTTHGTGLYKITVNAKNQITSMNVVLCDTHCTSDWATTNLNKTVDRVLITAPVVGTSFQVSQYGTGGNATAKDLNVVPDTTKVIKVIKTTVGGVTVTTLAEGSTADITAGTVALVNYTTIGTKHNADVVYVMVTGQSGVNPNPNPPRIGEITVNSMTYAANQFTASITTDTAISAGTSYTVTVTNASGATVSSVTKTVQNTKTANETFNVTVPYTAVSGTGSYIVTVTFVGANNNVVATGLGYVAVV